MLMRLHETSKYSAERQLYTLMNDLLQQKSIVANDVTMRITEIMTGKIPKESCNFCNQLLIPFIFRFRSDKSKQCDCKGSTYFTSIEI